MHCWSVRNSVYYLILYFEFISELLSTSWIIMSEYKPESSTSPKPSEEKKTMSGFSMSIQSSKTKILGNKSVLKKRRITDDQEEETERQTIEYISVFEDKKSKK